LKLEKIKKYISKFNPEFEDNKRALGIATFWALSTFIDGDSEYNTERGWGRYEGTLLKDIGPTKKGREVELNITGDSVTVNEYISGEDEDGEGHWETIYKFHVILQDPIIAESKKRMK
jgi:hypothetical protein